MTTARSLVGGSSAFLGKPAWIIGPGPDLLVFVNLLWPLVALVTGLVLDPAWLPFVLAFLALSHRWLTFPLIALDWDKLQDRRRTVYVSIVGIVGLFIGLRLLGAGLGTTGVLVYVFDTWHRSAQHYGMIRIYERLAGDGNEAVARRQRLGVLGLRTLVLYAFLRTLVLGTAVGGPAYLAWLHGRWLNWCDVVFLSIAAVLLLLMFVRPLLWPVAGESRLSPRSCYMASATILYGLLIIAVNQMATVWAGALMGAALFFHAVEYLAIVSRRVRHIAEPVGRWRQITVDRWYLLLAIFVLGFAAVTRFMPASLVHYWLGLNLLVSLLHYQLDGVIWRRST